MTEVVKIVIDGLGTATSISVLKALAEQNEFDCRVIGVDADSFCAGKAFVDDFLVCPSANDPEFGAFCEATLNEYQPDIWVPVIDYAFEYYSSVKPLFADHGCTLVIGDSDAIQIATSKWLTYQCFVDIGVPAPRTWLPSSIQTVTEGQFITKPDKGGRASIGVKYHQTLDELTS